MQFFISHLVNTTQFLHIINQYPIGIESIHFSISSILDEGSAAIKNYQKELGTSLKEKPLILHGPFLDLSPASFDSKIKKATMERFEEVYSIAQELNASKIVFHSGFIPQMFFIEGWLPNSIAFWQEFMSNKDNSITICIENVFDEDYRPILELIQKVNHPSFKICLDVGHVHTYSNLPLTEWLQSLSRYISHIHLHNNYGQKDQHLGLSNGSIPIKECLSLITQMPVTPTITLEIYDVNELNTSLLFLSQLNYI